MKVIDIFQNNRKQQLFPKLANIFSRSGIFFACGLNGVTKKSTLAVCFRDVCFTGMLNAYEALYTIYRLFFLDMRPALAGNSPKNMGNHPE